MSADLKCISWGDLEKWQYVHMDCAVIVESAEDAANQAVRVKPPYPKVCPCDCKNCKRAWWAMGRPVVRDGVLFVSCPRCDGSGKVGTAETPCDRCDHGSVRKTR